jgi:histidine triad (HIT) family protein
MLPPDQIDKLKNSLLNQLDHFPEGERDSIKEKISSMSDKDFEEFLIENELITAESKENKSDKKQCIFCFINEGKIKSYKIAENSENIALLEINPLSRGHCLILPKKHMEVKDLPKSSFELAETITGLLKEKFSPKTFKIEKNEVLGHGFIEVIPIYGDEKDRKKAPEEELEGLRKILTEKIEVKAEVKVEKQEQKVEPILPKLKPRMP